MLILKGARAKLAKAPVTVGEYILQKRLADRLDRKQLAARLGVDEFTAMNWEIGRTKAIPAPAVHASCDPLPRIQS